MLGGSRTHGDHGNRGPDGVQKRFAVSIAVARYDEYVGGKAHARSDVGQVSCVGVTCDQRSDTWKYEFHNAPRVELGNDAPSQCSSRVNLTDDGGHERNLRCACPTSRADLCFRRKPETRVDRANGSVMQNPWHASDGC